MNGNNFLIELALTTLFFFDNLKLVFNWISFELRFILQYVLLFLQNYVNKGGF